jgi:hypothetical protein
MDISRVGTFLAAKAPTILTIAGSVGVVVTVAVTIRATWYAAEDIWAARESAAKSPEYEPSVKEDLKVVWKHYIPVVGSASFTIACYLASNRVSNKRVAALATVYQLSEQSYSTYRKKVEERLGKKESQEIRRDITKDHTDNNPKPKRTQTANSGGVLCLESFTGRYFWSDVEALRKAQNDLNHRLIQEDYVSLTDFYNLLGLTPTSYSDEVGWRSDVLLELVFLPAMTEDNQPCLSVDYSVMPIRKYHKGW